MSGGDSSRAGTLGRSDKPTEAQRTAALAVVMLRYELGLDDADQSRDIVAALDLVDPERLNAAPVPQPDSLGRRGRGPAGGRQRQAQADLEAS